MSSRELLGCFYFGHVTHQTSLRLQPEVHTSPKKDKRGVKET